MFAAIVLVGILALAPRINGQIVQEDDDLYMHPHHNYKRTRAFDQENFADYWNKAAQQTIKDKIDQEQNTNVAKNVILFMGDGMSIPTLKATRLFLGELQGKRGAEVPLSFEKFPYAGLSKTYCVDTQVADSACSATAYLCGVKANDGTIGVTAQVTQGDCAASKDNATLLTSIARWSQLQKKRTGLVTTTRVTHASPAGVYAQTADRDWEASSDKADCTDIAAQLVYGETGSNLNVVLGGGRRSFIPSGIKDEEGASGKRKDGRNMIEEWLASKDGQSAAYVWNRTALLQVPDSVDYLMGLFEASHCEYHLDANPETEPTLEEMTESAIKVLAKGESGYFLFVEGGRIDQAHHDNKAQKALDETIEFSKAVQRAVDMTSREDTLIVVTTDHSHVMAVTGYPQREESIFGIAGKGSDGVPYTTISYANGPGYRKDVGGARYDCSKDDLTDKNYAFFAGVPKDSETHGGDDVAVFALGPWAHLFSGVVEQNVIPHTMAYAACVGDGLTACNSAPNQLRAQWAKLLSVFVPMSAAAAKSKF